MNYAQLETEYDAKIEDLDTGCSTQASVSVLP